MPIFDEQCLEKLWSRSDDHGTFQPKTSGWPKSLPGWMPPLHDCKGRLNVASRDEPAHTYGTTDTHICRFRFITFCHATFGDLSRQFSEASPGMETFISLQEIFHIHCLDEPRGLCDHSWLPVDNDFADSTKTPRNAGRVWAWGWETVLLKMMNSWV